MGQCDRFLDIVIRHDGGHRPEGLDVVNGGSRERLVAVEKHRIEEGALLGIAREDPDIVGIAGDDLGIGGEVANALADLVTLRKAGERSHANPFVGRIAERRFRKTIAERLDQGLDMRPGRDHAADRRAFLAGLRGHLAGDFLDEEIEFLRAGAGIRAENGGVEAVGLHGEAHRIGNDSRMRLQLAPGPGRAGEGHGVLAFDMIEQVADGTGHQLQCAFGQDAGLDDAPDHEFREVRRLAGRLDQRGYARDQRRGDLLEHAPDGEVERVDMDRDPVQRGQDMLGGKAVVLGQKLDITVGENPRVRQLAAGLRRIGQHRAYAAFDVDPAIGAGRARERALGIELLLHVHQDLTEGFQHLRALVEGQRTQVRAANLAAIGERGGKIDAGRIDECDCGTR